MFRRAAIALLFPLLFVATACAASGQSSFRMGPGRILTWYGAPRIGLAGDADGDGRADFLGIYPPDGIVDFQRMTPLGKIAPNVQARADIGRGAIGGATGKFTGHAGVDVLVVFGDGTVKIVSDMADKRYRRVATAGVIAPALLPHEPLQTAVADLEDEGRLDVVLCGADGRLLLLRGDPPVDGTPKMTAVPITGMPSQPRRIAAGRLVPSGAAELVWIDRNGGLWRAELRFLDAEAHVVQASRIAIVSPDDGLCVGRFRGERVCDIIAGQRLLPAGDAAHAIPLPELPGPDRAKTDAAWLAADFNGDGRDDLVRCQRSGDPVDGDHVYIHYAHGSGERPEQQFEDSANDGLPDAWKLGAIHPAGLDLRAMGCKPNHADLIVEIQPHADVPSSVLMPGLEAAKRYYASVPIHNRDGTTGIAIHFIVHNRTTAEQEKMDRHALYDKLVPADRRSVTHWMLIWKGGGGQSDQPGTCGECGCYGWPQVFIHEMGHQLGLDHTGRWPIDHNPLYHSVMNYVYNYATDAKGDIVGYSTGELCGIKLNPKHLSKRIPVPPEKLAFIAGPPYRFHIKPGDDGKSTIVDWNWDGNWGEESVAADITYAYSTSAGTRCTIGTADTAPALVSGGPGAASRLIVLYGRLPDNFTRPAGQTVLLSPAHPGRLCLRTWQAADTDHPPSDLYGRVGPEWTGETVVEPEGVTGDPSAVLYDSAVWVAYPSPAGVQLRRIPLSDPGHLEADRPILIPDSAGAVPTLALFGERIALLLWRDPKTQVGLRLLALGGERTEIRHEVALGFTSAVPVGAVEGPRLDEGQALFIGGASDQPGKPCRWQLHTFVLGRDGYLRPRPAEWIGGEKGGERGHGRISLLWESSPGSGSPGQVYLFARGGDGDAPNQEYVAQRVADQTVNGGWLTKRFYDEWTNSPVSCGVCWFRGDIAYASHFYRGAGRSDDLFVAFHGRGIVNAEMGDFDDVGYIRDFGLCRSLPTYPDP